MLKYVSVTRYKVRQTQRHFPHTYTKIHRSKHHHTAISRIIASSQPTPHRRVRSPRLSRARREADRRSRAHFAFHPSIARTHRSLVRARRRTRRIESRVRTGRGPIFLKSAVDRIRSTSSVARDDTGPHGIDRSTRVVLIVHRARAHRLETTRTRRSTSTSTRIVRNRSFGQKWKR